MFEKLRNFLKFSEKKSGDKTSSERREIIVTLVFIVGISYFSSSVLVSLVIQKIVPKSSETLSVNGILEDFDENRDKLNYRNFQKSVLDRNIFNDSGAVPPEQEEAKPEEAASGTFTLDGPCSSSSLKLKLLGTISLSKNKSFATVREDGVAFSDIYRVNDQIYGKEGVSVAQIRHNVVVLNNNGKKECLYATKEDETLGAKGGGLAKVPAIEVVKVQDVPKDELSSVRLEASFVQNELGPGFTKIMQSLTTPPNVDNGGIRGFKFFGIRSGSLLDKIGLKDGDVVLSVNGKSTSESIFVLYQALSDETEVLIGYERDGEQRSVRVLIE